MSIINKIKNIFSGRALRKKYIFNIIETHFIAFLCDKIININKGHHLILEIITYILFLRLVFLYLQFYPLFIKRIHDINKSAWCLLYFPLSIFLIFSVASIVLLVLKSFGSIILITIWLPLIVLSYYIFVIILMFKKGTSGSNKYGEEPTY
jgi:uncharacterized membrane protein YhaH (DUF805 family)